MARIRTVKPQHWSDKELPNISLQAHLLWIGIWNFSDDKGIIEADPFLIRSQVFPRRKDIRVEQVSQWLDQLVKARFLIPFEYNNESYFISRTFETHQKIDKPQPSKIPSDTIRRIFSERSTNDRPCIVKDSIVEVRESNCANEAENESELETKGSHPPPVAPPPSQYNGPPLEEVKRFFRGAGGTDEMAQSFWNKWEATGWMDGYSRIKNWTFKANNFITTWYKNDKNGRKTNQQDQQPRGTVITGDKDYGRL